MESRKEGQLMEQVTCNICHSDRQLAYTNKGQHQLECNVVLCRNCGFVYLSPRWNEGRYLSFYADEYNRYYRKEKAPVNTYQSIHDRLQKNGVDLQAIRKILDIGSGDGSQIYLFKEKYPAAAISVIEPSREYEQKLKEYGHTYVSNDVNSDWELDPENRFDLIIMRHVLEHMLEPDMVLKKIREAMNPESYLYIAVPNAMKIESDLFGSFFRVVHTLYYSVVSLTNVLQKNGFEILCIREGDESNREEIFVIAKKGAIREPLISASNFDLQYQYFEQLKKRQAGFSYRFRQGFQRFLSTYLNPLVRLKKKLLPKKML